MVVSFIIPTFVTQTNNLNMKNIVNVKNGGEIIGNPENPELFRIYINTIGKYKPLSREEEVKLFKQLARVKDEDKKAKIKEKICKHNLLFVLSVAKLYSKNTTKSIVRLEDLVSEGNMGLYVAIDKFDYKTGNKFISYAVWHIRQQILKSIGDNIKNIRLPLNKQSLNSWIIKTQSNLEQSLGRPVDLSEIFDVAVKEGKININSGLETFTHSIEMARFESSLSTPLKDDNEFTLSDTLKSNDNTPYESVVNVEMIDKMYEMLDSLLPWVKDHIMDYYGLDGRKRLDLREIGFKNDVSQETIRQRINKALRQLKFRNRKSKDYFLSTISEKA